MAGETFRGTSQESMITNFGSPDWQAALRDEIKLTSPETQTVFKALWRKNERSLEKKLGIFSPPKFNGDIVQDLGVRSDLYPLNIFFEGPFHNAEAEKFFTACKEVGQWDVIHPVKGPLVLQLISVKELMNPVEHGNYTEFETSWILPANQKEQREKIVSAFEQSQQVLAKALTCVNDAQMIFDQLKTDAYSVIQSSLNIFNKVTGIYDKVLKQVASVEALAKDAYDSMRSSLNGFLDSYGIGSTDTTDIGGALTNLAIAATNSSTDFSTRTAAFENFIDEVFTQLPTDNTPEDFNKITGIEFSITIALIMIAQITATSTYKSRADVVAAMERIISIFNSTVAAIEEIQDSFSELDIDFQYFSQLKTYTSLIDLYSQSMSYLIAQFFNLRIEKIITLKKARSPIEICISEYGDFGENDENYSLLLESNNLHSKEILLCPAGKTLKIYV